MKCFFEMIKRKPTSQVKMLYRELRKNKINAVIEYYDGHKCVDIGIPDAHIYIEVDGKNHITNPKQIETDFKRDQYSASEGFATMHIANEAIESHLEAIAKAIAIVANERKDLIRQAILKNRN